jgi:hypothetical protein
MIDSIPYTREERRTEAKKDTIFFSKIAILTGAGSIFAIIPHVKGSLEACAVLVGLSLLFFLLATINFIAYKRLS